MRFYKVFISIVLLVLIELSSGAQINVDNTVSPLDAMQTLLGENVTISNLQFSGIDHQIGTFDCIDCGLDFEEGVILATGDIITALGPNISGFNGIGGNESGFPPALTPDADLSILNPGFNFHDLVILEFDFVALGDSVWFDYVWASDEYPEFSTSEFNDTFGFFMSGPGLSGPYSNNGENIALIPGTNLGVTMNNINDGGNNTGPCINCEFYEPNGTGNLNDPEFTDDTVIGYDGYTVGLRAAKSGLVCGETYHLKIAVADVGDEGYDSAVFLKSGSLSSNLTVQIELIIEATTAEGVMNEECGLSILHFIRPEAISSDIEFVVEVAYAGDAINGIDYTAIPEDIIFAPGVDTISFVLDAFEDGLIEGMESVQFEMQNLAVCQGEAVPSFFEFFITESSPLEIEGYNQVICDGASALLEPIVLGGSGGFIYDWSTGENASFIEVSPPAFTTYNLTVSDTCLASTSTASFDVDIASFPPLTASLNPTELDISCNWFGEFLTAIPGGGDGTYSYEWINQDGNVISTSSDFFLWDNSITALSLIVTDGCGFTETADMTVVSDIPLLIITVPESVITCPGEEFQIDALVTGQDPIFIDWIDNSNFFFVGNTESITYQTDVETSLTISAFDNCGQNSSETVEVIFATLTPLEALAGEDQLIECEEDLIALGSTLTGVAPYAYSWSTADGMVLGDTQEITFNVTEDEVLVLTVDDSCGQTDSDSLNVVLNQIPLEITIPAILNGDCLTEFSVEAVTNLAEDVPLSWDGPADMLLVDNYNITYQSLSSAYIEVTGDAGCDNSTTESIQINISSPELSVTVSPQIIICPGESATINAQGVGGSGEYNYEWTGEGIYESLIEVSPSSTSFYTVEIMDECLNFSDNQTQVAVLQLSTLFMYNSIDYNVFELTPSVIPACEDCTFYWEFTDGLTSTDSIPTHTFNTTDEYGATLTVSSPEGCIAQFTEFVYSPIIYIPNSFTPNNDGLNDVFKVSVRGISEFSIQIFNRWGDLVHESTDPNEIWQGGDANGEYFIPNGVYSYVVKYKSLDTQAKIENGTITVFR
jgi:gliding motility-associated-like protein